MTARRSRLWRSMWARWANKPVARTMMLAYDDEYSINWMGRRLRPYWRRNGMDAMGLLNVAAREYEQLESTLDRL